MPPRQVTICLLLIAVGLLALTGCVRRTISITSTPPGALVYLNDREVGRTPLQVDFLYYGDYDVRMILDGHEPLVTMGEASAPWWDQPGIDLVSEMLPGQRRSEIAWHYELTPEATGDASIEAVIERAHKMQERLGPPPGEPDGAGVDPDGEDGQAGDPVSGAESPGG